MNAGRVNFRGAVFALMACLMLGAAASSIAEPQRPRAKVIRLESAEKELPILSGPPETVTMRSGLVTLDPGQSIGKHGTGQHEEMLVILEGKGEMLFKDGSKLDVQAKHALYCPPQTEHDVINTGSGPLRYVYVVASTR